MRQDTTTLERAFELANAGQCKSIEEIKSLLQSEAIGLMPSLEGSSSSN
jgi:hypothetical protein